MKGRTILIQLLYEFELAGLKVDYAKFRKQFPSDTWYIKQFKGGKQLVSFSEIATRLLHYSPLDVSHQSDPMAWHRFSYLPIWSRKWPAFFWTSGFSVIALITFYLAARKLTSVSSLFLNAAFWIITILIFTRPWHSRFCDIAMQQWVKISCLLEAWRKRASIKRAEQKIIREINRQARIKALEKAEKLRIAEEKRLQKEREEYNQHCGRRILDYYAGKNNINPYPNRSIDNLANRYRAASIYQRSQIQSELNDLNDSSDFS